MHAEAIQHLFSDSFIRTIPSVPELHRFSLCGSRTFTAGGELHSAPKQIKCIRRNLAVITLYTHRADLSIGGRKLFRGSLRLHAEFVERRELFEVPRDALRKLVREHYLRVAGVEGEPYALAVEPAAQLLGLVGKLAALVEVAEHFEALQLLRRQESLLEAVVPRQNEPAQLLHGLSGSTVISAAACSSLFSPYS